MRILHLGKYFPPVAGGMERYLGDLVAAQRAAGHQVMVLVHAGRRASAADDPPEVRRCPVWFNLVFAPISPAFPFWLRRAVADLRPDVIHLHLPNLSAFWALALASVRSRPWVVHWHSDVEPSRFRLSLRLSYPFYRVFERAVLEHAALIVATSPPYLEASRPLRPWRDKCRVVPLGADRRRLPEVPAALAESVWPGAGLRLLAIGRLTYYKGYETLIRAVAAEPAMQLVIVGEGEERPGLERLLAELACGERIRLPGGLDDAACQRLLAGCDLFCLPSRERTEAFGIVLLEAMRYGRPVVASRLPGSGVTWVVDDGTSGLLLPPEDVDAWRAALRELAADPGRRQALGAAGRARYRDRFGIDGGALALDRLYRSLLPAAEAPPRRSRPLVVIPALNEAASIGGVVAELRARGFTDVLVVDDGSRDATAEIARAGGARVIRPLLGQGAWGAMQTGIRYALRQGYPAVVTMDADGQHEPADLAALVAAGASADVVIGACPSRGSAPRRLAWAYFRRLTGFTLDDLTSGFRYYGLPACRLLAEEEATLLDYQDVGVLLLLHRAGLSITEVPVSMNPRQNGASRIFSSWLTVVGYMAETTLLCMARWNVRSRRT